MVKRDSDYRETLRYISYTGSHASTEECTYSGRITDGVHGLLPAAAVGTAYGTGYDQMGQDDRFSAKHRERCSRFVRFVKRNWLELPPSKTEIKNLGADGARREIRVSGGDMCGRL